MTDATNKRLDAIESQTSTISKSIDEMRKMMTTLVRLEEKSMAQNESLSRAFNEIDQLKKTQNENRLQFTEFRARVYGIGSMLVLAWPAALIILRELIK